MFSVAMTTTQGWTLAAVVLLLVLLSPLWARIGIAIHHRYHTQDTWRERVQRRFARQGTMAWMFAWFKLRLDAMFTELPAFFEKYQSTARPMKSIVDIGCGYGMTGCALLEWLPDATVYGLDPSASRAKVAQGAFGKRGDAAQGAAPDFLVKGLPENPDAVFVLDVIHFLNDEELTLTLKRIAEILASEGLLFIRAIIPPQAEKSWLWRFDTKRRKCLNIPTHHRPVEQLVALLNTCGFHVIHTSPSGNNPELAWFVAQPTSV